MRAVQIDRFGGPEVLRFVDVDVPVPGQGQIVVEVRAVGVNPADWVVREGALGGPLPQGTGFDVAGVVSEIGDGVEGAVAGQLVFGVLTFGSATAGAAEYALMDNWAPVPDGMSAEQAAAIPMVAETAVRTLDELGVREGHTLLVNGGSGAVGQLAVQLAVRRGAHVIATSGEAKAAAVRELGAQVTSYGEGLAERVRALAPNGVDRVLDMGPAGALPELIALAGDPAHVLTISDFANAAALGVRASGREGTVFRLDAPRTVADAVAAGTLTVPVWRVEPWENIAEVQETIKSGKAEGKTILRVSASSMPTHTEAEAEAVAAIQEAVGAVGLGVESPSRGPDRQHDLILINPRGGHITIDIKRTSLVAADGLAARIKTWSSESAGGNTIGVVVADRVTEEAREVLRAAGWGWLDLRGHLRIVGQGMFIDTDVPALKKTPGRTDPLAGHVGMEVATFLLLKPDKPAAVRGIASALGRAPSSVSETLTSMRAAGLVDAERRPVTPELFWELVPRWRSDQADVQAVPRAGDGTVNTALKIGLDDIAAVGWALGDTVAAAAWGAPVSIRSDHPLDFYVPDQATLRRALRLLAPAHDHNGRAATVRVAPVPTICSRRVDATAWTNEVWPLALPLFVALDLAQDPGRGREVLADWTPPEQWHRVW